MGPGLWQQLLKVRLGLWKDKLWASVNICMIWKHTGQWGRGMCRCQSSYTKGPGDTILLQQQRGVSRGTRTRYCQVRKQFDDMWSGGMQVVTKDLKRDFCLVGLERAWMEGEIPVRMNELSEEATAESWRRQKWRCSWEHTWGIPWAIWVVMPVAQMQ